MSSFDSIPHERLMGRIEERISDGRVLGLIRSWLGQDILRGMERWAPTAGTPQGAVITQKITFADGRLWALRWRRLGA